ncbi:MAG: hypothetical protein JNK49_09775 [Planctomycetes bacterium]|nr:hypothetical protein [Planctomycetota bacterium]
MIVRSLLALGAAFLTTSALLAQVPVTVRCTPTDGSAAGCYYCPGYENVIKLTGVRLHSSTVNLVQYHNLDVVLTGTWNGNLVEVTSVQLTNETFSISGNVRIGSRADFSTVGPIGLPAANLVAFNGGFSVPIADLAFQLAPSSTVVLAVGSIGNGGEMKSRMDIPNVPSLVGLRLYGQGMVLPSSGVPYSTNVDMKQVQ